MKKNLDMTEGKPISLLWAFTFPTLMGNLLNQVYSITDSIVVGRYLGQTALAAVGSTMPVILLLAALMIGINVGVGIIISRYFGQKNEELMRRAFVNSLYLGLFLSAGMMVMGLTFSGTILRWMGTPEGPLQEATAYLEISFITMICPLMYYLFSSAFRGLGDSQTALYCLIVSVSAILAWTCCLWLCSAGEWPGLPGPRHWRRPCRRWWRRCCCSANIP